MNIVRLYYSSIVQKNNFIVETGFNISISFEPEFLNLDSLN